MEKKKLDIPDVEWMKTKKAGVVYLESMKGGSKHKVYYIRYRHRGGFCPTGKRCSGHFEKVETAETPSQADSVRQDRIRGKEKTNEERRLTIRAEKKAEEGKWTISKLFDAWAEANANNRGLLKDRYRFTRHLEKPFGKMMPHEIDEASFHRVIKPLERTRARETVISVVSLLKRIGISEAERKGVPGLPFKIKMKSIKGLPARTPETITRAQADEYIKTCREWPNPQEGNFGLLVYYTGARRGSVMELKWEDVSLRGPLNSHITFRRTKTDKTKTIPISPELFWVLFFHPRTKGNSYVFTGSGPEGQRSTRQVVTASQNLREAAGFPASYRPNHAFRRFLATDLNERGASLKEVMAVGGWETPTMALRYISAQDEQTRKAILLRSAPRNKEENGKEETA